MIATIFGMWIVPVLLNIITQTIEGHSKSQGHRVQFSQKKTLPTLSLASRNHWGHMCCFTNTSLVILNMKGRSWSGRISFVTCLQLHILSRKSFSFKESFLCSTLKIKAGNSFQSFYFLKTVHVYTSRYRTLHTRFWLILQTAYCATRLLSIQPKV